VPLTAHPTAPVFGPAGPEDYRLVGLWGFCFDTTVAAYQLVSGGVFDAYPNLQLVLAHLGARSRRWPGGQRRLGVYSELKPLIARPPTDY